MTLLRNLLLDTQSRGAPRNRQRNPMPLIDPPTPPSARRGTGIPMAELAPAREPERTPVQSNVADQLSDSYLVDALVSQDRRPDRTLAGETDVHVSQLTTFCVRSDVLDAGSDEEDVRQPWSWDHMVWKIGRAVEAHVRDSIIADRDGRGVYGVWHCPCKETRIQAEDRPSTVCLRCTMPAGVYSEYAIRDSEAHVVGRCDLPLVENGIMHPVEIKSMKHEDWSALVAPLGEHVFQVASYRRLYALAGWTVSPYVRVLYASKGYERRGLPYKSFRVDASAPQIEARLDDAWERARQRRAHIVAGTLPPRHDACPNPTCSKAKACKNVVKCFLRP